MMLLLLLIVGAWLALLLLVLGMLRATTRTPTPRPVSATPLTLVGDVTILAAEPDPSSAARRGIGVSIGAA